MIIVVGSVNVDFVIKGARIPRPGETIGGGRFLQVPGGKGANQAVAALRASESPVAFVAAVGDDALGRSMRDRFLSLGLNGDHIAVVPSAATGVALIMVAEDGENAISVAPGANGELRPSHIDALPDDLFRASRVLLASLEVPRDTVARAVERARRFGLLTIVNPAPADPFWAARSGPPRVDFLTPNETEASQLVGIDDPRRAAAELAERTGASVLLTEGARGAGLFGTETGRFPAKRVTPVDTTAAGDAWNGAFAAALAEHRSLADAARFAVAAGTLSVTRDGAQPSLPGRREILEWLAEPPGDDGQA